MRRVSTPLTESGCKLEGRTNQVSLEAVQKSEPQEGKGETASVESAICFVKKVRPERQEALPEVSLRSAS